MNHLNIDQDNNVFFNDTLSEVVNKNNNYIFTITLKKAFKELKKVLKSKTVQTNNPKLNLLEDFYPDKDALMESEYSKTINIDNDKINLTVAFKKALDFDVEIDLNETPLLFENTEVCSFSPPSRICDLINYHDENNFTLRLNPKDQDHEIILVKADFKADFNFTDHIVDTEFIEEHITNKDKILIPMIKLDLESNYPNISNEQIYADSKPFMISSVEQKVKFELNNKGAKVESQVEFMGKWNCAPMEPKRLIFDKPFIVYLRRKTSNTPYFVAYISNIKFLEDYSLELIKKTNAH